MPIFSIPNYSLDTYYAKIIPSIIYRGLALRRARQSYILERTSDSSAPNNVCYIYNLY